MSSRFLVRLIARKGAEQGHARGRALDNYAAFGPLVADVLEIESWLGRPLKDTEARTYERAFTFTYINARRGGVVFPAF